MNMSSSPLNEEQQETASVPSTDELHLSHEETVHLTKNRIVAVDIVRLLAAFIVMFIHLPYFWETGLERISGTMSVFSTICMNIWTFLYHMFPTPSNLFFVLAGYFACRNITWRKACKNAWWCLVPFVLWCGIIIPGWICYHGTAALSETSYGLNLFGINRFFISEWAINPNGKSLPVDLPLWFMRDLIFLFLFSPVLYRSAKYIFPAMIILSLIPYIAPWFNHDSGTTCSLYSIFFFTGGCFLRCFSKEIQTKTLQFCSIWFILAYLILRLLIWKGYISFSPIAYLDQVGGFLTPPIPALLSIWVLYQIARWLELHIRFAKDFALKYAPVTFLTFAVHFPLYTALKILLPTENIGWLFFLPFICFLILTAFFFAMKRWCRPLLHPVAHYVLRPDDLPTRK